MDHRFLVVQSEHYISARGSRLSCGRLRLRSRALKTWTFAINIKRQDLFIRWSKVNKFAQISSTLLVRTPDLLHTIVIDIHDAEQQRYITGAWGGRNYIYFLTIVI